MARDDRRAGAITDAVQARRDRLIALTQEMVRIPTLNPPGDLYGPFCEMLRDRLHDTGWQVQLLRAHGAPGDSETHPRWNLIARLEGARPGETVHFNSHHDVVPVGEGWTRDPFGAALDQGRIWGRGTCDMKGGLATSIIAAEAFRAAHPDFSGAIEVSSVADEESGGFAGAAWLARQGWFDPARVQHVIIPEPLHKDRICLGHRGVWWAEITAHGRIAHGSMPFLGDSAIAHIGAVLHEIDTVLQPALAARRTAMPVIPEGARASTLNINAVHGGEAQQAAGYTGLPTPCVADRCRIVLDRRFLAEESIDDVKAEIRALMDRVAARRGFTYDLREMFEVHPSMTDRAAPVVQAVAAGIEAVFGRAPGYVASPGTYDQKHVDGIGGLRNVIAYGPGVLDLAHQPDEWIGVDDMIDSACVMALALERILGRSCGPEASKGTTP
ncbi:acetylornithine deacetylase/succinyl-diaminopimelate desuccinylase family protein [Rhodobaculum claviforme]|uniref:Succinyl-diaminopimelate desuccinylase n=1 Tax=Rhodobaculum claviforme TaxID=1549854 RepID=A0A934WGX9_9RHOB|nr:acetylornithine deacetylase/succinyl-diaminopimelate desuccinylase family protein [Rhodobaculum claviforme]MBK5925859.1 succinyl-diaminopimelate desuccinylase [Rhodobaculum claviforme]